jgi:hypothetical protein
MPRLALLAAVALLPGDGFGAIRSGAGAEERFNINGLGAVCCSTEHGGSHDAKRNPAGETQATGSGVQTPQSTPPRGHDEMIAVAAYYLAERHAFEPGHEIEDWLEAEKQIDAPPAAH